MDLSTRYLGFDLPHPFMPGASPLVDDLDQVRRLEDAGASMIVMHSLFEEQLSAEALGAAEHVDAHGGSFSEALTYFPSTIDYALGPDEYLDQLRLIKQTVSVPVVASLNGVSRGGWLEHAKLLVEAGADALELNVYYLPVTADESGADVEQRAIDVARTVREATDVPLAMKLSPYYSALPNLCKALEAEKIDALVLFNRFYQPDIDLEELGVVRELRLSDSSELLLRLRWLAMLFGKTDLQLACTGGVHTAHDALKATMAGASAVQLVSALLVGGPERLAALRSEVAEWLEVHEYESLSQARGSMSFERSPDPGAYERANYIHLLQGWSR